MNWFQRQFQIAKREAAQLPPWVRERRGLTTMNTILTAEQVAAVRAGDDIYGFEYVLDSHEQLRARVAALEAENARLEAIRLDSLALVSEIREDLETQIQAFRKGQS